MKKLSAALIIGLLFANHGEALAQDSCIQKANAGAATVQTQLYEKECALITFSSGMITRDYTFNCCGPSAVIRVNLNDWEQLLKNGKLDGFRYQLIKKDANNYSLPFRKVVGTNVTTIPGEDFFK